MYEVIGDNNIAVPTHYFKVLLYDNNLEAYVLPNTKIPSSEPLEVFRTEIENVERSAGIVLNFTE